MKSLGEIGERPGVTAVPGGHNPDAPVRLKLREVIEICRDAAELGAAEVCRRLEPQSDNVSQNEAWRLYGRQRVEEWVRLGYITTDRTSGKHGSKILMSRAELAAVNTAARLHCVMNRGAVMAAVEAVRRAREI